MPYASRNGYVMSHMPQPLNGTSMNGLRLKVGLGLDVSLLKNYVESGLRRTKAISRARVDIQPTPQHNVTTGVARHHTTNRRETVSGILCQDPTLRGSNAHIRRANRPKKSVAPLAGSTLHPARAPRRSRLDVRRRNVAPRSERGVKIVYDSGRGNNATRRFENGRTSRNIMAYENGPRLTLHHVMTNV